MFRPKRWRKRRERAEPVSADAPLCEDEVELIFDEPTYDEINGGFVEGFKEGIQPGLDAAKENIDTFNNIMNGDDTSNAQDEK